MYQKSVKIKIGDDFLFFANSWIDTFECTTYARTHEKYFDLNYLSVAHKLQFEQSGERGLISLLETAIDFSIMFGHSFQ